MTIVTRYVRSARPRGEEVKVAYVSTYPPRECGIATFCEDLLLAARGSSASSEPIVIAMEGGARYHRYSRPVVHVVDDRNERDYQVAAEFINDSPAEVVNIQHEFGIYGGVDGGGMYRLLDAIRKPLVTILHTVLPAPDRKTGDMIRALVRKSQRVVVMNPIASQILRRDYGLSLRKLAFINHGAPPPSMESREALKQRFGVAGRRVMCTFGLVGLNKGLQYAIQALPSLVRRYPDLVYLIVGQTHPGAIRDGVDDYRESLTRVTRELGLEDNVRFVNRYLTKDEIVSYLGASDVYITPYLNQHQICSGTLAYAMAAGKAIVATPYLHARFLLGGGRGLLTEFASAASISETVGRVLAAPELQAQLESRTRAYGQRLLWTEVGTRYRGLLGEVLGERSRPRRALVVPGIAAALPPSAAESAA